MKVRFRAIPQNVLLIIMCFAEKAFTVAFHNHLLSPYIYIKKEDAFHPRVFRDETRQNTNSFARLFF